MELWSIKGDGDGNFIAYPIYISVGGLFVLAIIGIFKVLIEGKLTALQDFANTHSVIILVVLAVLAIVCAAVSGIFLWKSQIVSAILFGTSLFQSLSLCYCVVIYWVTGWFDALEEVFIIALMLTPVYLFFMVAQLLVAFLPAFIIFTPYLFEFKTKKYFPIVVGSCVNIFYIWLIFNSELPKYISNSIS